MNTKEEETESKAKQFKSLSVPFETKRIPTEPSCKPPKETQHMTQLHKLFESRPIWLRNTLVHHLEDDITKNHLKQ
jgi:hypothetical protein